VSSAAEVIEEGPPATTAGPMSEPAPEPSLTVIEPTRGWHLVNFREVWRYRELLYFLAWRDVKVRYKQTVLGAAWAVIQPLATMVVFSLFVGRLVKSDGDGIPYPLFVFAGLIPWAFFSNVILSAGMSIVGNQNLVTKVYFPRLIIPISCGAVGLIDFAVSAGILLVMMACNGVAPGLGAPLVPVILLVMACAAIGIGCLLAALTVAYRDFRSVVPFAVQLWMFATPCIYLDPAAVVGPTGRAVLPLNPAYGLILNFRQALLGGPFDWYALAVSSGVSLALLCMGCLYFRRVERSFADIV
jgi:lipopolysaccharide transport system permease protein